jgi:hypothetical protein
VAATRKKRPKAKVRMARLVKLKDADRSFDIAFWRRVGAEGRFVAAWQMVEEVSLMRGDDGHIGPPQRSVVRLVRRRRLKGNHRPVRGRSQG